MDQGSEFFNFNFNLLFWDGMEWDEWTGPSSDHRVTRSVRKTLDGLYVSMSGSGRGHRSSVKRILR